MHPLFFFLILFHSFSNFSSAKNDKTALFKIKEQMGNPVELSSWDSGSEDYCLWGGTYFFISCNSNHRVNSFSLRSININNATFPPAIFELTELEELDVSGMAGMHGEIPYGIGNLTHLKSLSIRYTSLSGPIPSSLGETNINLTLILMEHNKLSGPIPESISNLKNLNFLVLRYNQLTGPIPANLIRELPSLPIYFDLSYNDLSGELPNYYGTQHYNEINLNNNRLSGDVSFMFGNGKSEVMNLAHNSFSFDLSHIEPSNNLHVLDLSYNRIWGSIPQWLEDIGWIVLSNNQLCGPIPMGSNSWQRRAEVYENNTCLCGGPLSPCCD